MSEPSAAPTREPSAERTPATRSPSRALRALTLFLVKLAVAAVVLILAYRLVAGIDWARLGPRMASLDPALAAVALALLVGRYLAWQERWALVLGRLGETTTRRRRTAAITASVAVNHATPYLRVFGAVCRARYISRSGRRSFVDHYGGALFEMILHNLVFGALLGLAALGVAWSLGYRWLAALGLVGGVAALGYLLRGGSGARKAPPLVAMAARKARRQSRRLARLAEHGRELAALLRELFSDRALVRGVAAWTLGYGLGTAGAQWVVFRALGLDVGLLTVIAVVGGGVVIGTFTGTPGGVATTEAAMTAGYAALGVDPLEAAAATLLFRGFHYLLVVVLGLPALVYFELVERRTAPRGAPG